MLPYIIFSVILLIIVIAISIGIRYCVYKTVSEIMERKGYPKGCSERRQIYYRFWRFGQGHWGDIISAAELLPPNSKSPKEREYLLGPEYIFRGFGKEGALDPKELIEPIPETFWQCSNCGAVHAPYVGACGCGSNKPKGQS